MGAIVCPDRLETVPKRLGPEFFARDAVRLRLFVNAGGYLLRAYNRLA